jgi:hypothetical protein
MMKISIIQVEFDLHHSRFGKNTVNNYLLQRLEFLEFIRVFRQHNTDRITTAGRAEL